MSRPEDLEPRVSALETEVQELRSRVRGSERDAATARVLAGGADRDVEQIRGEIRDLRRALTAGFNATREDILDLRRRFDDVDRGFAEVRGTFDAMAAGQQQIVALLTTVIDQQGGVGP